jgi:hypothetical protein
MACEEIYVLYYVYEDGSMLCLWGTSCVHMVCHQVFSGYSADLLVRGSFASRPSLVQRGTGDT